MRLVSQQEFYRNQSEDMFLECQNEICYDQLKLPNSLTEEDGFFIREFPTHPEFFLRVERDLGTIFKSTEWIPQVLHGTRFSVCFSSIVEIGR